MILKRMPHLIKEHHLEEICAGCKKPHGNKVELIHQANKIYELITCSCGYKTLRVQKEELFNDKHDFISFIPPNL